MQKKGGSGVVPGFRFREEWLSREALPTTLEALQELGAIPNV
ncbi:MAG: hypothetical protein ACYCW6_08370 [Candidatus Xenobia bacterium]